MKNFLFLFCLTLFSVVFSPPNLIAQRDVGKTVSVLDLPDDFSKTDGIIASIQSKNVIVVERTIDHTVRPRDTSEVYKLVPTTTSQSVSFYSLNYWHGRLDGNPTITTDDFVKTSDNTYTRAMFYGANGSWFPEIKYEISPDGTTVKEVRNIGLNSIVIRERRGFSWVQIPIQTDYNNPPVTVSIVTFIKDSKRTQRLRTVISENRNLHAILAGLKMTRSQLEQELVTTFTIVNRGPNHIHSTCTEATGNAQEGYFIQPYYDGINLYAQRPTGKITQNGKQWPGVKLRWTIWNGQNVTTATGANQDIEFANTAAQSTRGPLKFVPGSKYSYDSATNTVTYNSSVPCYVRAQTEEHGSNFKSHSSEMDYIVQNGELIKI